MSKQVSFPVFSMMLTAILFILGILLASLSILTVALSVDARITAFLVFIGVFLLGWALLSFSVHPEVEENRRTIAFFFAVLLVTVLLQIGVTIATVVG